MIVVAATQNEHKVKEISAITKPFGFELISRREAGIPDFEIDEDQQTFEENSLLKAMAIHKYCDQTTLADDSGLIVDVLDGQPGVHSARFAGLESNDRQNNKKLLGLLAGVPKESRTARFVSVITMVFSEDDVVVARGECEGHICESERGDNGFGYDPLFIPIGYDKSFAELEPGVKNAISHRAKALQELSRKLDMRRL